MKKRCLLFWLLTCAASSAAASNTAESDMAFNTANNFLAAGQLNLAIENFKKAINLDDKNYFAYKGLGLAYVQAKNFREAEKVQRKCLDLNPDFADARNDLAATLMFLGRAEEARKEWIVAQSSPFNPTPDKAACNLGDSFLEEKNYTEATRWFQAALQKNETYGRAHVGVALSLMAQNKVDEAIVGLEKAVAKMPGDVDILYTLGDAYYRAGRFGDARGKLEAVVKADPVGVAGRRATEQLKHFPK
jgi:superkiller protein 3